MNKKFDITKAMDQKILNWVIQKKISSFEYWAERFKKRDKRLDRLITSFDVDDDGKLES